MELTEKEINRIIYRVQEYLGSIFEGNFKETKITKRGTEYTCITGFANFGLTRRQAKILKADPRGIEITVALDTKLQEGKLLLGNGYSEEVITKLTFDANYTNIKFLTTYDESRKTRSTGVYLKQIKEDYSEHEIQDLVERTGEFVAMNFIDSVFEDIIGISADTSTGHQEIVISGLENISSNLAAKIYQEVRDNFRKYEVYPENKGGKKYIRISL